MDRRVERTSSGVRNPDDRIWKMRNTMNRKTDDVKIPIADTGNDKI